MDKKEKQEEMIIHNLHDAGCSPTIVDQYMEIYKTKNTFKQLSFLSEYRNTVLKRVHAEQLKLDCLDYMVFQLKKQECGNGQSKTLTSHTQGDK